MCIHQNRRSLNHLQMFLSRSFQMCIHQNRKSLNHLQMFPSRNFQEV